MDSKQTSGNQTVEITNRQLSDLLVCLRFAAIYNSDSLSGVWEETKVSDQEFEAICSLATALQKELGNYSNEKLAAVLFSPEIKEVEITLPQEVITEALQALERHESRYFSITPFRDAKRVMD